MGKHHRSPSSDSSPETSKRHRINHRDSQNDVVINKNGIVDYEYDDDDDMEEGEILQHGNFHHSYTNVDIGMSSKAGSRSHSKHKSLGKDSRKETERHKNTNNRDMDDGKDHVDRRKSQSEKVGKVHHEALYCSPSRARNRIETTSDSTRSESSERTRERSQSILHGRHSKALHLHERDERLYDNGKVSFEVDDGRVNRSDNSRVGVKVNDRGTKRGSSSHMSSTREGKYEDDSWDKGTHEKTYQDKKGVDREQSKERNERGLDRDREKERHSYRSSNYGSEKYIRDGERPRDTKSDRIRDGSRDRDLDRERDRRQEKDRGRSRERDFDRERSRDKARNGEDYRSRRYHKNDDCEDGYRNRERRRSDEKTEYGKDRRTKRDPEKDHAAKGPEKDDAAKVDSRKKKEDEDRDDDEENNYQETPFFKTLEQEEEDIDRIKEESRKRREAILLKYKAKQSQHQQQQAVPMAPKVSDEQLMDQPSQYLGSVISIQEKSNGIKDNGKSLLIKDSLGVDRSAAVLGEGFPKSEKSNYKHCNDIFCNSPTGVHKAGKGDGLPFESHDNWDDPEGYYSFRFGEILDSRYEIKAAHGKGVFSTVVRAKDLKAGTGDPEEVAIKIIRNNETMLKAGTEELVILKKLVGADAEDRHHCVRYLSHFKYRNHLCIVFESLHMNVREVLKKFGRNIGIKLTAVRTYAKQLLIALKHLTNCGVLHCDIKPDNMLVNDSKTVLKLCDFGSAMFAGKNEITPYLISRFYRAPEIILGLSYDHPVDIWSFGCCLYELYSGKVLFPGPSNNDMLRLHMELKGPFPKKMLRKGAFIDQHFDHNLNFLAVEEDPVTKKAIRRRLVNIKAKDIGKIIKGSKGEDPKLLANFKDLLDKIFVLDPDKRLTVSQALTHPFITGK